MCSSVNPPSSVAYGAVPDVTLAHTTTGTDRLMLVGVSINNDRFETVTGVTYNGVALSLVDSIASVDDARVEIWSLLAPPTGTHDVVVTFDATLQRGGTVGVMTFTGVDQLTPLGPSATNANQTGTNATVDVVSAANELVFGVVAAETPLSLTPGALQADRWNLNNATRDYGAGSTEDGAALVTTNWTLGQSDHWAVAGVSIKPTAICGPSAALSGTVTDDSETDIRTGGSTVVLTLNADTWVAAGATFDAQRQNIIDGLTSAQSEANGWNAVVKPGLSVTDVVRTSDTVVTITLPAFASYDITATETIIATAPASALVTSTSAVVASPSFNVTFVAGEWGGGSVCSSVNLPSSVAYGAVPDVTLAHTTTGTDRLMLVGVSINNDSFETVTGVTYNGVALSLVDSIASVDDARVEIWSLLAPPTGTHDVVVTFNATLQEGGTVGVMTFTGVDQLTPLGPSATNANQTGTNATVDVVSAANELVFGVVAAETPLSLTPGALQADRWNLNNATRDYGAGSTEDGAALVTTNWTLGKSDHWAVAGVSIKPTAICGPSAALSGTVTDDSQFDIQTGGSTVVLTLSADTWAAAGATFDAQRQNIIDGLTSAQSEANGWNAVVKPGLSVTDVVRTSDTVVTITLPAFASYDITATESIIATTPASALVTSTSAVVASPSFNVTFVGGEWGGSVCSSADSPSSVAYGAVPDVTLAHTTTGTDRLMLVGVSINNDSFETVTGVTYNGVALALVDSIASVDDARVEIWSLLAPPTGTHDVVVTFNTTLQRGGTVGIMTFTGVNQLTPLGPSATNANQTGTNATVDVVSAANELVFGVVAAETPLSLTPGALQADRWNLNNFKRDYGAGSTEDGAALVTTNWTLGKSDHWAVAGVSIKPTTCVPPSVEPNSAGTVLASAGAQTISFLHTVTNEGDVTDSYALNVFSAQGWTIELVDPATMAVIATDSNGDGIWDAGTPNTGSLAAGASVSYRLRITIPAATPVGTVDSVELRATSDLRNAFTGSAFDEISVVDGAIPGAGDVLVIPDSASNAQAGDTVVYTHTVTNLTGATEVFDLQADSSQGWTTTIYRDTNGDGVYTPAVDIAITSTDSLLDGASQTIFVVIDVPGAAATGSVDITHLTARSQSNPDQGGIASDTTTVGAGSSVTQFNFSGGGSQIVNAGDTPAYPGTLTNTGTVADTYEFTISASVYGPGGPVADGLNHASQLWVDTNADGVADTQIARDDDGDGSWDFVDPAFDSDGDNNPDVTVAAGASLSYELRRPVDAAQTPYRDPVALTVTSNASGAGDSVTATSAILLLTRAVIGGLVAYGSADGVVVQWQTTSEHGTVGFHLLRFDEGSGKYRRVNEKLLPALLHSRNGGIYRYLDAGALVGEIATYEIVELEATGNRLTYGPYTVAVEINAEAAGVQMTPALDRPVENFERVERALSAIQEARMAAKKRARKQARAAKLARKGPQAKIMVRQPGAYYLDSARIAQVLGRSQKSVEQLIDAGGLVLLNGGKRVATLAAAGNTGLYFYGQGIDSQYTSDNVYWLTEGKGLAMASRDGRLPAAATGDTFSHTSRAEGNRYSLTHLFDDPDDDYWMWDFRFEDLVFPNYEPSYTVSSPGVAITDGAVAHLTVRLHGGTQTALDIDHRATITFNGSELGTVEFDGLSPASATFEMPVNLLVDGDNRIEVSGHATGIIDQPSVFFINDFALTYPRRYRAEDGSLAFSSAGHRVVSVDGFANDDVQIWNIGSARRPKRVVNAGAEELAAGYRFSFTAPKAPTPYISFTTSAARAPESVMADVPSDLKRRYHRVDYLIITASDLMDAAEGLAQYRRNQGLRAKVVDIEDIYDEFNHGIKNADAIWSFLHHAHTRWRAGPRYVVLAGEGSFDYKNYLGYGDSIVPTLLTPTPQGLFPSDNLYADVVGNDWLPEMAIGRLPVIDAAELVAVTAKIAAYEQSQGDWQRRVVVAADRPDLGGDFPTDSDQVADLMPDSYAIERIHLDELLPDDARSQMLSAFASGRAFVNFFGHSGFMSLGDTDLINVSDVPGLGNGERLPVVTAFTCLAGQFGFPGQESIAETLVITPDGGAAAMWSPSGLSLNNRARLLGEGFYASTFGQGELVIGEAILQAQAHYARDGIDKYLLDIYNLIGDPATIMK